MRLLDSFWGKGLVGRGLSIHPHRLKMAVTGLQGSKVQVLGMQTLEVDSLEVPALKKAISSLNIPASSRFAVDLWDKSLSIKKVSIPVMPSRDVPEALHWQLLEDAENVQTDLEVRYTPLPASHQGKQEYVVYGIARNVVENTRQTFRDLGLHVVVGEPVAVSLLAWQAALYPGNFKTRGVFYLREGYGDFIGAKGFQVFWWKTFPVENLLASPREAISPDMGSELVIKFQQCLDEFLLQYNIPTLEEGILAGEWDLQSGEMVEQSLGIPCKRMGTHPDSAVIFADEAAREKSIAYAAELGLSVYPKKEI